MKNLFGILAISGAVGSVAAAYASRPADSEAWSADYLELREILASSYANLGYASESGLPLRTLDSAAQAELSRAKTVRGARGAISRFMSAFGDPHLQLVSRPPEVVRYISTLTSATEIDSTTPAAVISLSAIRFPLPLAVPLDAIIVAHQDDWQLFMGDVVAKRVQTGNPVVFVYLTAGDDGRDSLYWATRERGALQSTLIATGVSAADSAKCSIVRVLDHAIRKCTIANTESYFLRLPDGHRSGIGFASHSHQSLRKLRRKGITSISAVDGSAVYTGWADLKSTVDALIGATSATGIVTVHTSDPSIAVNPHDHFDHRMAGLLVYDSPRKNKLNVVYYAGYAVATRAANRSGDQVRQKTALFLAYDRVMTQANAKWSAYREHPAFYSECMLRTYARRISSR